MKHWTQLSGVKFDRFVHSCPSETLGTRSSHQPPTSLAPSSIHSHPSLSRSPIPSHIWQVQQSTLFKPVCFVVFLLLILFVSHIHTHDPYYYASPSHWTKNIQRISNQQHIQKLLLNLIPNTSINFEISEIKHFFDQHFLSVQYNVYKKKNSLETGLKSPRDSRRWLTVVSACRLHPPPATHSNYVPFNESTVIIII